MANHTVPPYAVRKQLREATLAVGRRIRIPLQCNECGKKFSCGPNADPECPKCGGVDYDVREGA